MRTVLVGIARMGSSRLPGKVLMPLGGEPVLNWVARAAANAKLVDDWVIATTTSPKDDAIQEWCNKVGAVAYRGSEDDVLARFTDAAKWMEADVAVRVTCDCPFVDPHVIDQVIALREATQAHYASNIDPPTWPDGLDCEAIRMNALERANAEATSKIDRECVTSYVYRNRHRFRCETLICPLPGMHKERWVLDTEDDYEFCKHIAERAGAHDWLSIKRFLDDNRSLRLLNKEHPRNERYYYALAHEELPPRTYENSKKLLQRAEEIIPLGTQTFSKSKIQYPAESPLFLTHGDGGFCFDVDGNRYVDLVGGLLPIILGHRDPDVDYAARRQLNSGICHSLATELEIQLSELLCRLIPCAEMVRLGKNGSDVTSAAVRLARAHTGRRRVISSGYHGWHDWAVACDELRNRGTVDHYVVSLEHGDSPYLRKYDKIALPAAIIVEPETDPEFLEECRRFCDETGALLIFDEVITWPRFGLSGAQGLYNVTPDLTCISKAMANGYPISALVGKREYMQTLERTSYSGTFFGETASIAAAIACIEKLEREDVVEKILKRQRELHDICISISNAIKSVPFIKITGEMHLPRLRFVDNDVKTLFIQEMAQQGVLIIASHNLSYAHDDNCLLRVARAYQHVLPMLAEAVESGKVKQLIKGRSIPSWANVRAS